MGRSNIAILTTVANFELYKITSKLFPSGIKKYVIDGTNGMHGIHSIFYMFNKLSDKGIDWLILADEDVVFTNTKEIFAIIEKMKKNKITVCGVRDGGGIAHRNYNPIMVNTFFTILNFKQISKIWNKTEVKKHQYILPQEFTIDKNEITLEYDLESLYEPYYCFFLWLKRKGKTFLYLESEMMDDGISNSVLFNGRPFAYHTWYARSYKVNEKHTRRINKVLDEMGVNQKPCSLDSEIQIYKDSFFPIKRGIKKYYKKVFKKLRWHLD